MGGRLPFTGHDSSWREETTVRGWTGDAAVQLRRIASKERVTFILKD